MKTQTLEGKVKENPWGDWSDVDKGVFIGLDEVNSIFREFEGRKIKVTIEEIVDTEE